MSVVNAIDDALDQLRLYGLVVDALDTSGKVNRVPLDGRPKNKKDGWYVAHQLTTKTGDLVVFGSYGCWRDSEGSYKIEPSTRKLSPAERAEMKRRWADTQRTVDAEAAKKSIEAAKRAAKIFAGLKDEGASKYLARKKVAAFGLRFSRGSVVVPVKDIANSFRGLQFIDPEGGKKFLTGTAKKGAFHVLGDLATTSVIAFAEGYATGATIKMAMPDWTVVVVFDAGNLKPVCEAVAKKYAAQFVVCGDDDFATDDNPGRTKGDEAAEAIGARAVYPSFAAERGTDWNDLHCIEGLEVVKQQLAGVLSLPAKLPSGGDDDTPDDVADDDKPFGLMLSDLLKHFTIIHGNGLIWDGLHHRLMRLEALRLSAGQALTNLWLEHDDRRVIDQGNLVFDPGLEFNRRNAVNMYTGIRMVPNANASCKLILAHLHNLCGGDDGLYQWVLRWVAYPLQNPGAKMRTSVVMHGIDGTGKNIFWEAIIKIYGRYGLIIGQAQMESEFNDWVSQRLFAVANEVVSRQELRHLKGKLKAIVADETVMINPKGLPGREESNHINFVFLSNEEQPLIIDRYDRRYTVIRYDDIKPGDYYKAINHELYNGGFEALYDYLLKLDLGDFYEHTKPYNNAARRALMYLGTDSKERFYLHWRAGELDVPYCTCTAHDLYQAYRVWCKMIGEKFSFSQTAFGTYLGRQESKVATRFEFGLDDPNTPSKMGKPKRHTAYQISSKESPLPKKEADVRGWVIENCQQFHNDLFDMIADSRKVMP